MQQCQWVHVKTGNHIFSSVLPCQLIFFSQTGFGYYLRCRLSARISLCSATQNSKGKCRGWVDQLSLNAPWKPHPLSNSNLLSPESRTWMLSQTLFTYFCVSLLLISIRIVWKQSSVISNEPGVILALILKDSHQLLSGRGDVFELYPEPAQGLFMSDYRLDDTVNQLSSRTLSAVKTLRLKQH